MELFLLVSLNHDFNFIHCRLEFQAFFSRTIIWTRRLQLSDFMGYNENAVRWQIWTGLLAYLLLRFISWEKHWKHTFSRLYTLIRGVLLNYFDLSSVIQCCDTMGRRGPRRIRGAPEQAYQLFFDFA